MIGPAEHGVALYAGQLAGVISDLTLTETGSAGTTWDRLLTGHSPVHLHFTDRVFGRSAGEAADRVVELAKLRPLTLTLHDLPQPSDGPESLPVRAAAYRRIVQSARGVVCNSRHEVALLNEFSSPQVAYEPAVIPLPVIRRVHPQRCEEAGINALAILGYFYPGKGHAELVNVVATIRRSRPTLGDPLSVLALGASSPGHHGDAQALMASAAARSISFSVSGFLPEVLLARYSQRVAVPVAAHQHVSASGSVNSWIGFGRRPLVPATRYFEEMATLRPGTLTLFRREELADMVIQRLVEPETTWLVPGQDVGPDLEDVARQYISWWQTVLR